MNIYEKISKVRMAILQRSLTKDKKAFSYNYIDLPQIEPIITEECSNVGLLTIVDFPQGMAVMKVYDLDAKNTGEMSTLTISAPCDYTLVDIKGSQPIQKVGGMMTYMRRYLYMTLFAISEHDAVEGIGKLSQESANDNAEQGEPQTENQPQPDPRRAEIIEKFNKTMPNYLEQLVAYKHATSLDDFSTDFLEEIYRKKNPKKAEETTNG